MRLSKDSEPAVRKLTLHNLFDLGKKLDAISNIESNTDKSSIVVALWWARDALRDMIKDQSSPLLDVAQRAAGNLISAISRSIADEPAAAFKTEKDEKMGYAGWDIGQKLNEFESVLSNEMPSVPAFIVSKKGIYSTEDLIFRAINHFSPTVQAGIPGQVKTDICEAGKCLAFELSTACSFHLWRAVEGTMCAYYESLTGRTVEQDLKNRNWAIIIDALKQNNAAESVTGFLDHIRESYRNPQVHPEVTVTMDEAFSLFGAAASSINQQILVVLKLRANPTLSLLPAASSDAVEVDYGESQGN